MKTLAQLGLILAALLLINCDPDDDNNNEVSNSIIGEWQLTSIVFGVGSTEEPLDDCDTLQFYNY